MSDNSPLHREAQAMFPRVRIDTIQRLPGRFARRVKKLGNGECWPWLGQRRPAGYGVISVGRTPAQATHVALLIAGRPRSAPDSFALHSCDNPECCNPAHLRWGTAADNSRDRDERGRTVNPKGERHGQAKLTDDAVRYIRKSRKTLRVLSEELGVSITVLSLARAGKTWRHVR